MPWLAEQLVRQGESGHGTQECISTQQVQGPKVNQLGDHLRRPKLGPSGCVALLAIIHELQHSSTMLILTRI